MVDIPTSIKLLKTYDVERLKRDLEACERARSQWVTHHRVYEGTSVGRSLLELRSRGGRLSETFAYPNELEPYADTPLMEHAPYVRQILDEFDTSLDAVLFTRLDPGGKIKEHEDGIYFSLGHGHLIRVHIPIITSDDVWYVIGGQRHMIKPGEMWCGDFAKPHWYENRGTEPRTYLMVNMRLSEAVFKLFPKEYVEGRNIIVDPPRLKTTPPELTKGFTLEIPGSPIIEDAITRLPTENYKQVLQATFGHRHEVRWVDGKLWGFVAGKPTFLFEIETPNRLRIVDQPATLNLQLVDGAPAKDAVIELYAYGQTFNLPVQVGALS